MNYERSDNKKGLLESNRNVRSSYVNKTYFSSPKYDTDKVKTSVNSSSVGRHTNRASELRIQAFKRNNTPRHQSDIATNKQYPRRIPSTSLRTSSKLYRSSSMDTGKETTFNQPVRNQINPNMKEGDKSKIPIQNILDIGAYARSASQMKIPCDIPLIKSLKTGDHVDVFSSELKNQPIERSDPQFEGYEFNGCIVSGKGEYIASPVQPDMRNKTTSLPNHHRNQQQNHPSYSNTNLRSQATPLVKDECQCSKLSRQGSFKISHLHKEVQTYSLSEWRQASDINSCTTLDTNFFKHTTGEYTKVRKSMHDKCVSTQEEKKYSPSSIFQKIKNDLISFDKDECNLSNKSISYQFDEISPKSINKKHSIIRKQNMKHEGDINKSNSEESSSCTPAYRKKIRKFLKCLHRHPPPPPPPVHIKSYVLNETKEDSTNLYSHHDANQTQTNSEDKMNNSKCSGEVNSMDNKEIRKTKQCKQTSIRHKLRCRSILAHYAITYNHMLRRLNRQITGLYNQHDQGFHEVQKEFYTIRKRLTDISDQVDNICHCLTDHKIVLDTLTRVVESNKSIYNCNNRLADSKYNDLKIDNNDNDNTDKHSPTITIINNADGETDWIDSDTGDDHIEICTGQSIATSFKYLPTVSKDIEKVVNDTMKHNKGSKTNLSSEEYTIITENNSNISNQSNNISENNKKHHEDSSASVTSNNNNDNTQILGVISLNNTKAGEFSSHGYDYHDDIDSQTEILINKEIISSHSPTSSPPTLTYMQQNNTDENINGQKALQRYYRLAYISSQDVRTSSELLHTSPTISNNLSIQDNKIHVKKNNNRLINSNNKSLTHMNKTAKHHVSSFDKPVCRYNNNSFSVLPCSTNSPGIPVACKRNQALDVSKSTMINQQKNSGQYSPQKNCKLLNKQSQNSFRKNSTNRLKVKLNNNNQTDIHECESQIVNPMNNRNTTTACKSDLRNPCKNK
uniref:Uncharacterized protein n=1 Tax=Trichobilharzia regenti TaxID=157069 RepID=A0AA85JMK8_TRIRE|nr:unnamed protein product [Trichobilharzia regenti]